MLLYYFSSVHEQWVDPGYTPDYYPDEIEFINDKKVTPTRTPKNRVTIPISAVNDDSEEDDLIFLLGTM